MCAHTVIFLHDVEEGPRGLRFLSFVKRTPTRGEKLISSQNGTKFARTKWGVGSSLKSTRYPGYVSKRHLANNYRSYWQDATGLLKKRYFGSCE